MVASKLQFTKIPRLEIGFSSQNWNQFFFSFGHQQVQILVYQSLNCIKSDKNRVQANWTILDLLILNVNEWKIISWYLIPYHTLDYARAVQAIVGVLWISICFVGSSHTRAKNFGHKQVQILVYQSLNCIKSNKFHKDATHAN